MQQATHAKDGGGRRCSVSIWRPGEEEQRWRNGSHVSKVDTRYGHFLHLIIYLFMYFINIIYIILCKYCYA